MLQVAKHLNLPKAASSLVWHGTCRIRRIHWPSRSVRSTFTEFFKGNGHQHIRSSPVIPWNDPSLAFVNAGMNQVRILSLRVRFFILCLIIEWEKFKMSGWYIKKMGCKFPELHIQADMIIFH